MQEPRKERQDGPLRTKDVARTARRDVEGNGATNRTGDEEPGPRTKNRGLATWASSEPWAAAHDLIAGQIGSRSASSTAFLGF